MTRLPRHVGSAEKEVYNKLRQRPGGEWRKGDRALYENGGFTEDLLERLTSRGLVQAAEVDGAIVYRAGKRKLL